MRAPIALGESSAGYAGRGIFSSEARWTAGIDSGDQPIDNAPFAPAQIEKAIHAETGREHAAVAERNREDRACEEPGLGRAPDQRDGPGNRRPQQREALALEAHVLRFIA